MRLSLLSIPLLAFAFVIPPPASSGEWEKWIAPGVTYRSVVDAESKLGLHVVEVDPKAPGVRVRPELGGGTVFERLATTNGPGAWDGRETAVEAARRLGAVAVLNADFFPYGKTPSGDPLGVMVKDGEIISTPVRDRAVFAWGPAGATVAKPKWAGTAIWSGGVLVVDGVNERTMLNGVALATRVAGSALVNGPSAYLVLRTKTEPKLPLEGSLIGVVESVIQNETSVAVPEGCVVLSGQGTRAASLASIPKGATVSLEWSLSGIDAKGYDQVVGGGPWLLRDGENVLNAKQEGFPDTFSEARHPRSAIGRTADGRILLVEADGRSPEAAGLSLKELAERMKGLGCVDAVNLDGGGSSSLAVRGAIVNRPSDGKERAVANFVAVYADSPATPTGAMDVKLRPAGKDLIQATLTLGGKVVPNAEVVWSLPFGAWSVDQGGLLRKTGTGESVLRAAVAGRVVRVVIP